MKYFNTHELFKSGITREEYLSCVFDYFYSMHLKEKYDDKRASFSTFVYWVLSRMNYSFILSIKNGLSINQARNYLLHCQDEDKQCDVVTVPLSLQYSIASEGHDNLEFEGCFDDGSYDYNNKMFEYRDTLDKIINIVINSDTFTKREKDILLYMLVEKQDATSSDAQKHFNVSRQRVNQIVQKLRKLLRDKNITF